MKRWIVFLVLCATFARGEEPKVWVHAPAEDLLALFPEKGAGFLISVEEYDRLRARAAANTAKQTDRPPLAAHLASGVVQGEIDGDVLRLTGQYLAVVHRDGATSLPFRVQGAAVELVTVDGGDYVGGEYVDGALRFGGAGTYDVTARLSVKLTKNGERRHAKLQLPAAAGHKVVLKLPASVHGEVGPIVRQFKSGDAPSTVVGYPNEHGTFSVWLEPRSPARELSTILSGSFATEVSIGEARTVTKTKVGLLVQRASLRTVEFSLAKGQTIRGVTGKKIRSWRVVPGAVRDTLAIAFIDPLQGRSIITIDTEAARGDKNTVDVAFVRLPEAVRYEGSVSLRTQHPVRLVGLSADGARRADSKSGVQYRVWKRDATVQATVERLAAKTRADTTAMLAFREEGKSLRLRMRYTVAGQPLFRLEPTLPKGWILRWLRLNGAPFPHRYLDDGRLVLEFPFGLKPGTHTLELLLDTDEVDWVPNEGQAKFSISGIRSGLPDERGVLVVASDEAFRVQANEVNGLTSVGMPEIERAGFVQSARILYGWRFDTPDYAAQFQLVRHRPQITATVVETMLARERLLNVHNAIRYDIQRAGVRELYVVVPKGTGPLVEFNGPAIKERRAPKEGAETERWTIVLQRRVRGAYALSVKYDKKFEKDTWETTVPGLQLPDVADRGFVLVSSMGTTAIDVDRKGLREADVGELPSEPATAPLEVLAYTGHPHAITIRSQRHDPEAVVQAIALSSHIYGVLTEEGMLRCRAEYRVRNNDQPFLSVELPARSKLIGVVVDGKPAKPLIEDGQLKLALPRSKGRETPFVVAVVYESKIDALQTSGDFVIARPALDIDVLKTRYSLHLPRGITMTGHDGDLVPDSIESQKSVLRTLADLVLPPKAGVDGWLNETTLATGGAGGGARGDDPGAGAPRSAGGPTSPASDAKPGGPRRGATRPNMRSPNDPAPPPTPEDASATRRSEKKLSDRADVKSRKSFDKSFEVEEEPEEEVFKEDSGDDHNAVDGDGDLEETEDEGAGADAAKESLIGTGGGAGGGKRGRGGRKFVAQGKRNTPAKKPNRVDRERARAERALLSLDVQFLKPDNIVRLDSMAPTGAVTLHYVRTQRRDRQLYLGLVLGAALGLALVVARLSLLRVFPAIVCAILALHFGGQSFLPGTLATGMAQTLLLALGVAVALKALGLLRKIRLPRRVGGAALPLVLAALASQSNAEEEILVPYRKGASETVERVFLPADQYHRLRALADPARAGRTTAIRNARYQAEFQDGALTLRAEYEILKEVAETERIPLALKDVAVLSATLNGKPATLGMEKEGYVLVMQGKGQFRLVLNLRARVTRKNERYEFRVPVRPVADATLGIKHNLDAHTVDAISLGGRKENAWQIGPVGVVGATWTPKTEGYVARNAELRAQTGLRVFVRDGYTGVSAKIHYNIAGGSTETVRVRLDPTLAVRAVTCPNLAGWRLDGNNVLIVALAKPATRQFDLQLFAERAATRERTESLPTIEPLDVVRDAGVIALDTLADIKLEVKETKGLLRGRANQTPDVHFGVRERGSVQSVYRYAVRPFSLRWQTTIEETRTRATWNQWLYVDRTRAFLDATLTLLVERGPGIYRAVVTLPAGYEVVRATGGGLHDWWVRDGKLILSRQTRQTGSMNYNIVLRRRGKTVQEFQAPALSLDGATRQRGDLKIALDNGLEMSTGASNALLPLDIAKLSKPRWGRVVRAYRFVSTPWQLALATREEPREIEALVVSRVVPLADRVRVEALIDFHVRRGLVDELTFFVPAANASDVVLRADDLREEISTPVDGGLQYTLKLRTPTRSNATVTVLYHVPNDQDLRGPEPKGVSRVRRYVAVEKIPDGSVRIGNTIDLDPSEFDDLPIVPPGSTRESLAQVLVGSGGPFTLRLDVTRHTFEEVASAVIYRAAAQTVVERSGWVRTLISYRVYNRAEQFLNLELPAGSKLYSVVVAGKGVRPLGDGGRLLIPLRKLALGAPTFDVDVLYAYRDTNVGKRDNKIALPKVVDLEVRRTTLALYLPKGFSYDFDTKMEKVEAADLAAGEATDLYQEIKELYAVAERGNELQSQRANFNANRLQMEARRAMDRVRASSHDTEARQQIDTQMRALKALASENTRNARESKLGKAVETVDGLENQLNPTNWRTNPRFLSRNPNREAGEQVANYARNIKRLEQTKKVREAEMPTLGAIVKLDAATNGVASASPLHFASKSPANRRAVPKFQADELLGRNKNADAKDSRDKSGLDNGRSSYMRGLGGGTNFEDSFVQEGLTMSIAGLKTSVGRLSLRIDLPREGEVYYFARLGAEGGCTVTGSGPGWPWGKAALTIVFVLGFIIALRCQPLR